MEEFERSEVEVLVAAHDATVQNSDVALKTVDTWTTSMSFVSEIDAHSAGRRRAQ
jgi:hypothetical protein